MALRVYRNAAARQPWCSAGHRFSAHVRGPRCWLFPLICAAKEQPRGRCAAPCLRRRQNWVRSGKNICSGPSRPHLLLQQGIYRSPLDLLLHPPKARSVTWRQARFPDRPKPMVFRTKQEFCQGTSVGSYIFDSLVPLLVCCFIAFSAMSPQLGTGSFGATKIYKFGGCSLRGKCVERSFSNIHKPIPASLNIPATLAASLSGDAAIQRPKTIPERYALPMTRRFSTPANLKIVLISTPYENASGCLIGTLSAHQATRLYPGSHLQFCVPVLR